jgi:hypothetical protein
LRQRTQRCNLILGGWLEGEGRIGGTEVTARPDIPEQLFGLEEVQRAALGQDVLLVAAVSREYSYSKWWSLHILQIAV